MDAHAADPRIVLVNVLVFCVLAELLALFLFYNETGRLFYTYRKPYEPIGNTAGRLTGDGLHPYFGPTHRHGATRSTFLTALRERVRAGAGRRTTSGSCRRTTTPS